LPSQFLHFLKKLKQRIRVIKSGKGRVKKFQEESKLTVEAHDIKRLNAAVIEQGLQFFGGIRLKIKTPREKP
jgi:hypothetical protein